MVANETQKGDKCGFIFRIPIDPGALPISIEVRVVGATG
jgi:hypothetical protein